jgi:hypothetical protein
MLKKIQAFLAFDWAGRNLLTQQPLKRVSKRVKARLRMGGGTTT